MTGPPIPLLTHPRVKVTVDTMGYIVIRWKDEKYIHNMNYHVQSSKHIGWSSTIRKDV